MNLDLSQEQKLIQETARDFAKTELEPITAQLDKNPDRGITTIYEGTSEMQRLFIAREVLRELAS